MSNDPFRYDRWIIEALCGVVRRALDEVAARGLWGGHHFYVTFDTNHPGVTMPPALRQKYPQDMTIVLQYEFWDLVVTEDFFEVTLSFNNVRSRLHVPFDAVSAFADPEVKFGLQLKVDNVATGEENGSAEEQLGELPSAEVTDLEEHPGAGGEKQAPRDKGKGQGKGKGKDKSKDKDGEGKPGEVIALDQFRKK